MNIDVRRVMANWWDEQEEKGEDFSEYNSAECLVAELCNNCVIVLEFGLLEWRFNVIITTRKLTHSVTY